jgi:uncharacterized membrane protein
MSPPNMMHAPPAGAAAGQSCYAVLIAFPVVCFTLALLTDLAYFRTLNLMWAEFSAWLLLAGIVFAALAALTGAIEYFLHRGSIDLDVAWAHAIGNVAVLIIAFFNNLIHARDGWTSVVPWGIALSALTVLVIIVTASYGASLVHHLRARGRN